MEGGVNVSEELYKNTEKLLCTLLAEISGLFQEIS